MTRFFIKKMEKKILEFYKKRKTKLLVIFVMLTSGFFLLTVAQSDFLPSESSKNLKSQLIQDFQTKKTQNLKKLSLKENSKNKEYTFVIAPHPDDEILCCGRTLREKIEEGKNVKIIFLTKGDAFARDNQKASINYGEVRKKESVKAAGLLGLKDKGLFFLDFPDGYLGKLNNKYIIVSDFTGKKSTGKNNFNSQTPYTLPHLENLLEDIFKKYSPEEIYLPDEIRDAHSDHKIASIITQKVLKKISQQHSKNINIFKYIIHNSKNYKKGRYFDARKLKLIQVFKSQYHSSRHKKFLENFAKLPENFKKIKISGK